MLLKDKVVVISGVGPGLGRTLALEAAADGAKLVLGARNQEFLASVVAELRLPAVPPWREELTLL